MRAKAFMLAGLAALAVPGGVMAQSNNQVESVAAISDAEIERAEAILQDFAADYVNDPMALDATFGIKLGQQWWNVTASRKETASARGRLTDHAFGPHDVTLTRGAPAMPSWYFEIATPEVVEKIASGEVNAGTAAMQSFGSDRVGVEIGDMEGFKSTSGDEADMYVALSHFFTKGAPEVTRFSVDTSLMTHGAQVTSLHTMKGFRISYVSIPPQGKANADAQLSFGQMPNLLIVTRGKGTLYSNDGPMVLEKGMSVFIAPFVKHEFFNDGDEPMEGVLVLYGDNSDFAFGTSYPAYLQDLNDWHRDYEFRKDQPKSE